MEKRAIETTTAVLERWEKRGCASGLGSKPGRKRNEKGDGPWVTIPMIYKGKGGVPK